jgi:hypothetical protein
MIVFEKANRAATVPEPLFLASSHLLGECIRLEHGFAGLGCDKLTALIATLRFQSAYSVPQVTDFAANRAPWPYPFVEEAAMSGLREA